MQFAIILLAILTAACAVGSFVTQGQTYEWYARQYSERTAGLIIALHLDDAFHSWWFVAITVVLCVNLLLCNILRLPQLLKRSRMFGDPVRMIHTVRAIQTDKDRDKKEERQYLAIVSGVKAPEDFFRKLQLPAPKDEGFLFSHKNRAGLWGAWVCHLGILLLIIGFGFGQMTKKEYAVYGIPGQTKPIGDTGLYLTIDDFQVDLREDDTVSQYTAEITVGKSENDAENAAISVNHPASLYGMKFYQNSTGWAAKVTIRENGELLQEEVICTGEFVPVKDKPDLVIYLNAFYPDYYLDREKGPQTASGQIKNPAYLYTVYYQGSVLGMNALLEEEDLTIDDYVVNFSEPQNYTLIQIKKDPFTPLALAGGLITLIGLILAFYVIPMRVCAVQDPDGTWTVTGESRKGGAAFRERFRKTAETEGDSKVPG